MLVRSVTKRLEIPHEPGETMTLQRLSWSQLDQAREASTMASLAKAAKMGPELIMALRQSTDDEASEGSQYDKATVLCYGISDWSYDAEVTAANIDMLDEQTADWAFAEILKLNDDDSKNA